MILDFRGRVRPEEWALVRAALARQCSCAVPDVVDDAAAADDQLLRKHAIDACELRHERRRRRGEWEMGRDERTLQGAEEPLVRREREERVEVLRVPARRARERDQRARERERRGGTHLVGGAYARREKPRPAVGAARARPPVWRAGLCDTKRTGARVGLTQRLYSGSALRAKVGSRQSDSSAVHTSSTTFALASNAQSASKSALTAGQ